MIVRDLIYSSSEPDFRISFKESYHVSSNFVECRYYTNFKWPCFRTAGGYGQMVGHTGSPMRIADTDVTLTWSKVKVTDLKFRKLRVSTSTSSTILAWHSQLMGDVLTRNVTIAYSHCLYCQRPSISIMKYKSSAVPEIGDCGHNSHGPKSGGPLCSSCEELGPRLIQCGLGQLVYFRTKWRLNSSSRLATIGLNTGQKLGEGAWVCPFFWG